VLRNAIGLPVPAELDLDGNACPDACETQCCVAAPGAGCGVDPECEDCVCARDPSCCVVAWDALCASEHTQHCPMECTCTPQTTGDCCVPHAQAGCEDNLCAQTAKYDLWCPYEGWDAGCVLFATASTACGWCELPLGGCCEPHFGKSCNDAACAECVCATAPSCCSFLWDEACTERARGSCIDTCGCEPPPQGESCCEPQSVPGCNVPACEACVCAKDPLCCDFQWDSACAYYRVAQCSDSCACFLKTGTGNCCDNHEGKACAETACAQCVCEFDPWCCTHRWDKSCAGQATHRCSSTCACAQESQ
jgi:hypothetical protein